MNGNEIGKAAELTTTLPTNDVADAHSAKHSSLKQSLNSIGPFSKYGYNQKKTLAERICTTSPVAPRVNQSALIQSLEKQLIGQQNYKSVLEEKKVIASSVHAIKKSLQTKHYEKIGPEVLYKYPDGHIVSVIPPDSSLSHEELAQLQALLSKEIGRFENVFGNDSKALEQKIGWVEQRITQTKENLRKISVESGILEYIPQKAESYLINTYLPEWPRDYQANPLPVEAPCLAQGFSNIPAKTGNEGWIDDIAAWEAESLTPHEPADDHCDVSFHLKPVEEQAEAAHKRAESITQPPVTPEQELAEETAQQHKEEQAKNSVNLRDASTYTKGFINYGNTCFINSSLKGILYGFPPSLFDSLAIIRFDAARQPIQKALLDLNKRIHSSQQEAVDHELKALIRACYRYKDPETNEEPFQALLHANPAHIGQQDAQEFIETLMTVLKFNNNPTASFTNPDKISLSFGDEFRAHHFRDQESTQVLRLPLTNHETDTVQTIINKTLNQPIELSDDEFLVEKWAKANIEKGKTGSLSSKAHLNGQTMNTLKDANEAMVIQQESILMADLDPAALTSITIHLSGGKSPEGASVLKEALNQDLVIPVYERNNEAMEKQNVRFQLKSVCLHTGTDCQGHYTAAVKHSSNDNHQWLLHNDTGLELITSPSEVSGSPYLLFYERVNND